MSQERIPRIIHYCWFGGQKKNYIIKKCIATFPKTGITNIIEWNEGNCTFDECQYVREAFQKKAWAFVSDYYRLKALYEYGGVYLDTDVQIKKTFADQLFQANLNLGYMFDCSLSTAIIMACPHHPFIKLLLDWYEHTNLQLMANNGIFTDMFLKCYSNIKLNGKFSEFGENNYIYPKDFFEAPTAPWKNYGGYSVHHFTGLWATQHGLKTFLRPVLKRILFQCPFLNYIYNLYMRNKCLKNNPMFRRYLNDIKE